MSVDNKQIKCPVCGGVNFKFLFNAGPLDYLLDEKFTIMKCVSCGHGLTQIIDGDQLVDRLYEEGNYDVKEGLVRKILRPFLNVLELNKLDLLRRWVPSGSIFEIGVGKGYFLKFAKKAGYTVSGIEPSNRSRKFAQRNLGKEISDKTIEQYVSTEVAKFDAVCLWHVLEHLQSPRNVLVQIRNLLKKDGILMIAVPNFDSSQAKYGKMDWYHLDPPRHIHHFSPSGLTRILEENGYNVVQIYYGSFFQNWIGEIVTILNLFSPIKNVLINFIKSNFKFFKKHGKLNGLIAVIWNMLLFPIILLPSLVLNVVNQANRSAGTIVVFAKN